MAKQSGIHQIKGKVGEMSYYRQSGVSTGLLRSINQGLSARVKNGDEYVNTRRNMAEFGLACRIAGALGGSVIPKWRPMFLTFSQSAIAKKVLELIKLDTTTGIAWGNRGLTQERFPDALAALNSRAKNAFSDFVSDASFTASSTTVPQSEAVDVALTLAANIADKLSALGCQGVNVYVNMFQINVGNYNSTVGAYDATLVRQRGAIDGAFVPTDTSWEDTLVSLRPIGTVTEPSFIQRVIGVVLVPYRTINGTNYEMQEFATFQDFVYDPE